MNFKRVVITGLGTINPLGHNVAEFWENLKGGVSGAGPITRFDASKFRTQFACEVKNYEPTEYFDKKEVRKMDLYSQFALICSREAVKDAGLDLVKIAPTAKPPVCKIIDYGKYRYEQARKAKEAKKKQKTIETKEIRLSPNIDTNDLNTKVNQAKKFLQKGAKVKVSLRFRGREMAHKDVGREILNAFFEELKDVASVDKPAKMEGRSMVMFLSATK